MIVAPSVRYVRWRKSKRVERNSLSRFNDLTWRSHSKRADLFERKLSFDVPPSGNRRVHQDRAGAREQDARNCAKFAYAHRANRKIDILAFDEAEETRELNRCVGARRDLENVCGMPFRSPRFCRENP